MNPLVGTRSRAHELVLRAGILAVAGVQSSIRLSDFDLPWHLALGRHLFETRSVPRVDPLAFTHRQIGYMEFLSDAALWGLYRSGGALALQLFGALLFVGILLVYLRRARDAGPMALPILAVLVVAIGSWILVRPATLSLFLLPVVLLVLEEHRRTPSGPSSSKCMWGLVPLTIIWANLHGFVVLGVAMMVAYAAYRSACRLAAGRLSDLLPLRDGDQLSLPWIVAVGAAAGSGLNVAGYRLWTGPLRASADFQRILEWQSPDWSVLARHEPALMVLLGLGAIALALGREPGGSRWPNAFELGLWVGALALGQSAYRMLPIAALLIAPSIARRLAALAVPTPRLPLLAAATVPLAAPLLALSTATSFGVGFEPRHFPERAAVWIEHHEPRGRMWNILEFGGYLALRLHPTHLVLMDGRSGWVHEPRILDRYHASLRDRAAFGALAGELQLEWAITRASEGEGSGVPLAASQDWAMVYLDDVAAIYVRRSGPNTELGARGYRVLRHMTPLPTVLSAAIDRNILPESLAYDGHLAVQQAPNSPRARFLDACGALAKRDALALSEARLKLSEVAPGHPAGALLDAAAASVGLRAP